MASTVPTSTVSSGCTRILARMPSIGATSSLVILSVSTSPITSSIATGSPSCFVQARTVPSSIVKPHLGRITSAAIASVLILGYGDRN